MFLQYTIIERITKMKKFLCLTLSLIFVLMFVGCDDNSDTLQYNIRSLSFFNTDNIELKVGREKSGSYVNVDVRKSGEFSPSDIIFVSENENVATIEFTNDALTTYLYYKVVAVGGGETYIYAKAKDGDAVSEKIKVIVDGAPKVPDTTTSETSTPETSAEETTSETTEQGTSTPETSVPAATVLTIISVSSPVGRNETAILTIKGKPNTEYSINVYYSTQASTASGLEKKTSDNNGVVVWEWKVGGSTKSGAHRIVVIGGGERAETKFTTTE